MQHESLRPSRSRGLAAIGPAAGRTKALGESVRPANHGSNHRTIGAVAAKRGNTPFT